MKAAQVRFYVDADLLGLAKLLVQLRPDVTFPGDPGGTLHKRRRPPCPITKPETLDRVWLPMTAQRGWLIISRDWHINDHAREIAAVRQHRARMVTLASKDARTKFDQVEVFMCQWRRIEKVLDEEGPCIYLASRTSWRKLALGEGKG